MRPRSAALLLADNACFILPPAVILGSAVLGTPCERLTAFLRRHLPATKAATAALFGALAGLVTCTL